MRIWLLAALLAVAMTAAARTQAEPAPAPGITSSGRLERSLPCPTISGFVENRGQWPVEVKFFASRGNIDATLLADALVLRPQPNRETEEWLPPIVLRFPTAQEVAGQGALPTAHHFILAEGSASYVPGFERVVYRNVTPGIDLVVRFDGEWFAYDLHVAPGADLASFAITAEGVGGHGMSGPDCLRMETPSGLVEQRIGAAWETDASDATVLIASTFRLIDSVAGCLTFGFDAPGRDLGRPFVLDPSLVWSTFVGQSSQENVEDVAVAPDGSVYLAVKSNSAGPTTPGAFITTKPAGSNGWVGKLSPDGSTLEWGTFLGGSDTEGVWGIELASDGTVVTVGDTWSADFPMTPGCLQRTFGGQNDMFLSRLEPDGSSLVWSTFYGGAENDHAHGLALHPSGDVVLAAQLDTATPPATPGAFDTSFDPHDYAVTRFTGDGSQVVFQTYFGAAINEVVCDESSIVIGGSADSSLPATPGAFQSTLGQGDLASAFVARLDASGSELMWATFLGGDESGESVYGVAVDEAGGVYVVGHTDSSDFPVTPSAFDSTYTNDGGDGFAVKLL